MSLVNKGLANGGSGLQPHSYKCKVIPLNLHLQSSSAELLKLLSAEQDGEM